MSDSNEIKRSNPVTWSPDYKSQPIKRDRSELNPLSGWQPIETAPKDGEQIILWDGYCQRIGEWAMSSVFDKTGDWCVGECTGSYNTRETFEADMWMLCPDNPQ